MQQSKPYFIVVVIQFIRALDCRTIKPPVKLLCLRLMNIGHSAEKGNQDMIKFAMLLPLAVGVSLAACDQTPTSEEMREDNLDAAADAVREDADETADAMEERADMLDPTVDGMDTPAEEAMDARADAVREAGEAEADAIEDRADAPN
jgi:uncharacterized membrane protein YqiK